MALSRPRATARVVAGLLAAALGAVGCRRDEGAAPRDTPAINDAGTCVTGGDDASASPLAAVVLEGIDESGQVASVRFADYREACGTARSDAHLLVVRIGAPWCGPCAWHGAHSRELLGGDARAVRLVDAVVSDEENNMPRASTVAAYRARIDGAGAVVSDGALTLLSHAPLAIGARPSRTLLPYYLFVDTRTLAVIDAASAPPPSELAKHVATALATVRGEPLAIAPTAPPPLHDGLFEDDAWSLIRAIAPPDAPPPDPTNAVADSPNAAALGARLFADATLSPTGIVSCRHCHAPSLAFTDGLDQASGVGKGTRNAPSITLAAHERALFWDGRADTLWSQATGPLENPIEMGSSRLFVAHRIAAAYAADYAVIFGPLPSLDDGARFPPSGKPGDAAWTTMASDDRGAVTRVFVNVAKAIASFERTLRVAPNPLDAYAAGDLAALTPAQKRGLKTFFDVGCAQCHYGPRLTDDAFHVLRFPSGRPDGQGDVGRSDGLARLLAGEFRSDGIYSDAPALPRLVPYSDLAPSAKTLGAFKTPTLRAVDLTAPYGHGGVLATLDELLAVYATAGLPPSDARALGVTEPWVAPLTASERGDLAAFLPVLTGKPLGN